MNLLIHNSLCDFCLNSGFTKFHLALLIEIYFVNLFLRCFTHLTILLFYFTLDVNTVSFLRYFNNFYNKLMKYLYNLYCFHLKFVLFIEKSMKSFVQTVLGFLQEKLCNLMQKNLKKTLHLD